MSTPYLYVPLDENAQQIRILTLLPGCYPAQIRIHLEIVQLSTEHVPDFEALSYVWGSTEEPVEVWIESESAPQVLAVTQNLAEALYHLRYETQPRVLWIDAICINQRDIPERNAQIKRMADLYRLSWRVVAWLGPESGDSSLGLDLLRSLGAKIEVNWGFGTMKAIPEDRSEQHWADINEVLPYNPEEIAAIVGIFERPWFERLWIWQEIWLAGPSAILVCGKETILWTTLRNAFFCVDIKNWVPIEVEPSLDRFELVRRLCMPSLDRSFERLIRDTNFSKCMDPRDRVFALRSLLNPQDVAASIEPNYKKEPSKIYTEVFLRTCKKNQELRLMQRCELTRDTGVMPTWLPNWSVPRTSIALTLVLASGLSAPVLEVVDKQRIRLCGIAVATLENICHHNIWENSRGGNFTRRGCMRDIHKIAHQFRVSNTQLESFCSTLGGGFFTNCFPPEALYQHPTYPNLPQAIEFVAGIIETPHFHESDLSRSECLFLFQVATMLRSRVVYKTSSGTFGIAPKSAEPGDIVAVFLGCHSAMVLRPCDGNTYKVIGESYCFGYSSGEGLLGPLPNTHRMVWVAEENGEINPAYLELASNILHTTDPRLGELPRGWKLDDHDKKDIFNYFVNEETGEETPADPRLTPEALKARSIDIEYFDLI
jgi:hypothetical protein